MRPCSNTAVAPRGESKRVKLAAFLDRERPAVVDFAVLDAIRAELGAVSDSYLRRLLKDTGVPLAPLVEGVSQESFPELERTLVALEGEYAEAANRAAC